MMILQTLVQRYNSTKILHPTAVYSPKESPSKDTLWNTWKKNRNNYLLRLTHSETTSIDNESQ